MMRRWEYMIIDLNGGNEGDARDGPPPERPDLDYLNYFGDRGWELVAVTPPDIGGYDHDSPRLAYLKRIVAS